MIAFNFITNVEYSGQNAALVGNGKYNAFASFRQLNEMGYKVNKGAKSVSVFCGYRENKAGETVPCWGRVFDIVDTNALDDPDLVEFLDQGQRTPSEAQVNHELVAAFNGGAQAVEQVKEAYHPTKEVTIDKIVGETDQKLLQEFNAKVYGPKKINVVFA